MVWTNEGRALGRVLLAVTAGLGTGVLGCPRASGDLALGYSSYLGGSNDDNASALAVDRDGNAYIAGTTTSADFPRTAGTLNRERSAFVAKFNPNGALLYSTLLDGVCDGEAHAIAVDAAGNAYITGRAGFCLFGGGLTPGVLVAKLDPAGTPIYLYRFGESLGDSSVGEAIAIDADGSAYIAGSTRAGSTDFPTTAGAFQTNSCDGLFHDGFVAKVNPAGNDLVYCTLICGTGDDSPEAIAVDALGNAYLGGHTTSHDFPTANAFQSTHLGDVFTHAGFICKLNANASVLEYSTYFIGNFGDTAIYAIALDAQRNAFVTGETTGGTLPTTPGVVQRTAPFPSCRGGICTDAFVAKFSPAGSLNYCTYVAGDGDDAGQAIALDSEGNVYVAGSTVSVYFPILNAFMREGPGARDAFVTKLTSDGSRLLFSSYLGGGKPTNSPPNANVSSQAEAMALDTNGNIFLAGYTSSSMFPTTPGAAQTEAGGGFCFLQLVYCGDAFITKLRTNGPATVPPIWLEVSPSEVLPGGTVSFTWAGIPDPSSHDEIEFFHLGDASHAALVLASFLTTGTAAGTLEVPFPTMTPGPYEFRLMGVDPDFAPLLKPIARSVPVTLLDSLEFRVSIDAGGILHLRVRGLAAGTYHVEASDILDGGWQVVGNLGVSVANEGEYSENADFTKKARFYRVAKPNQGTTMTGDKSDWQLGAGH
jgi:hypothetical protein